MHQARLVQLREGLEQIDHPGLDLVGRGLRHGDVEGLPGDERAQDKRSP